MGQRENTWNEKSSRDDCARPCNPVPESLQEHREPVVRWAVTGFLCSATPASRGGLELAKLSSLFNAGVAFLNQYLEIEIA